MGDRHRREPLLGNVVTIEPLVFPNGPYMGCQKLSVLALNKGPLESSKCHLPDDQVWHCTAWLHERDTALRTYPVRQIGYIIAINTLQGAREMCDQWVCNETRLVIRESRSVVECNVLAIAEQYPLLDQRYPSFIHQYEVSRQVTYPPVM